MSTFHPAASSRANFKDTILLWLDSPSTSALIKARNKVCHSITAHTLWRFHGEHQVNMESFQVLFTCRVRCHVHVLPKRRHGFGGVVKFCHSVTYFMCIATYKVLYHWTSDIHAAAKHVQVPPLAEGQQYRASNTVTHPKYAVVDFYTGLPHILLETVILT